VKTSVKKKEKIAKSCYEYSNFMELVGKAVKKKASKLYNSYLFMNLSQFVDGY